jgi:polyhydroxyalkanoate synthase
MSLITMTDGAGDAAHAGETDPPAERSGEGTLSRRDGADARPPVQAAAPPRTVTDGPPTESVDRLLRAMVMRATAGRSPVSVMTAFADWAGHLALAPSVQWKLAQHAFSMYGQFCHYASICAGGGSPPERYCVEPLPQDNRFDDAAWQQWPFNLIHHAFLAQENWWLEAISAVPGVSRHHRDVTSFVARQFLDQFAPSNFIHTNPIVLRETVTTGGRNLWAGAKNFIEDVGRRLSHQLPAGAEKFVPGSAVAVTPGKIIYRNELIELIQYTPSTELVHPEPIFIVPAWIMKYYILDLSPENSLVRHLVDAGFTVFIVSWRNPNPDQRDLGMAEYLSLGIDSALAAISAVVPKQPIHAVGYCLGGTLLSIAAAALGRRRDKSLATVTLLAAQTDFSDAGELTLFIDDSEVTFIEDVMWLQGVLDSNQMAGAFRILRSNDLIWSRVVRDYLLGSRAPMTDLLAWNADATRMPYRMHSDYLRHLFLDNDLASGRYVVDGSPVGLSNIRAPMFVVATEWDHVAPWKSVYKIHQQVEGEVTFALTSGGHNMGIVNPPGSSTRQYRIGIHRHDDSYVAPDQWLEGYQPQKGSWWSPWVEWLHTHSSARQAPPSMGAPDVGYPVLDNAPGTYVFDR